MTTENHYLDIYPEDYEEGKDTFRYTLGCSDFDVDSIIGGHLKDIKKGPKNPLTVLGINPNKAKENSDDTTIKKLKQLIKQNNNYDGWIMINICPLRSGKPSDISNRSDNVLMDCSDRNLSIITELVNQYNTPTILLAFGDGLLLSNYFIELFLKIYKQLNDIKELKWLVIDSNKTNLPLLTNEFMPRHINSYGDFKIENVLLKDVKPYLESLILRKMNRKLAI